MAFWHKDLSTWANRIKIAKSTHPIYKMQPLKIGSFDKKPLAKHDGLAAVQKHPMLGMPFHRTSQRGALENGTGNF